MMGVIFGDYIRIKASQVIIERCKTKQIYLGSNSTTAQNVTIRQCYATHLEGDLYSLRTANCIIENCMIIDDGTSCNNMNFVTIKNCYLRTKDYNLSNIKNYTLVNSILINAKTPNNNKVNCSSAELEQNNIYSSTSGVTEATVFTLEGANDQCYQLKDDSPARGAAADGGDCGPYGGSIPYVAGGLPMGHPYYTKASIATRAENDKVKVSLQIKMQNE